MSHAPAVRWLIAGLVVFAALGASGGATATGDRRVPDANLTSGARYASDTLLAFDANATETTWGIYRVPPGETILTPVGEVHLDASGRGLIDLARRDLPPGSYAVGPSVYEQRRFENGTARPLGGGERAAFRVVEQSLDAAIASDRSAREHRVLTVRSNVVTYGIELTAEGLSPARLHAIVGGERTADGVVLDGGRNRTIPLDFDGIAPGRYIVRVNSTVGPATDTVEVEVGRSTTVDAYRAIDPPPDRLSPAEVVTAKRDYVGGEITLAMAIAVFRAYFFG